MARSRFEAAKTRMEFRSVIQNHLIKEYERRMDETKHQARLEADQAALSTGHRTWVATTPLRNLQRQSRERQRLRARIDREGAKHAPGSTKPWRDEAKIRSKKTAAKKARRKNR